jgi:hypothetical protein
MMVPNAALRYTPTDEKISPAARSTQQQASAADASASQPVANAGERRRRRGDSASTRQAAGTGPSQPEMRPGTIWVADGQYAKPVKVMASISDGRMTAVRGDGLAEGSDVIVGDALPATASAGAPQQNANPFIPQMPSRRGSGGSSGGGRSGGMR